MWVRARARARARARVRAGIRARARARARAGIRARVRARVRAGISASRISKKKFARYFYVRVPVRYFEWGSPRIRKMTLYLETA